MDRRSLTMRTLALIALSVLFNAAGNVLLRIGMQQVGEVRDFSPVALAGVAWHAAAIGAIWLGAAVLGLFLVSYLLLLSWADYSYVQPASAGGYAVIPLFGWLFAGERPSVLRWSGVLLIAVGVALVSRTRVRTTGVS